MPTTSYTDSTFSVSVVGSRTDSAGGAVTDLSAEEARFTAEILTEGYLKPTGAFKVQAQPVPAMSVVVGSQTAKADYYVVAGDVQGQGNYIVRLDSVSQDVTIDASDASQVRTDEIYLVVRDNAYDVSSRVLPQIGYRKGDVGGANPGPDASWEASVLLARVTVNAAASEIDSADISDQRTAATLLSSLASQDSIPDTIVDAKGDLIAATAADTVTRLPVGTNGQVLTAASAEATGLDWTTLSSPVGDTDTVSTLESTSSDTFTDLATVGPSVTVTIGASGVAIISFKADVTVIVQSSQDSVGNVSFEMTGANSMSAGQYTAEFGASLSLAESEVFQGSGTASSTVILTGLVPGSTTFTMKYCRNISSNDDPSFSFRMIGVLTF